MKRVWGNNLSWGQKRRQELAGLDDILTTCGCLVPDIMRIEDNVELVTVPQENKRLVPIHVEEPLRYNVGVQHASHGCPQAHYPSCHVNCHAK